MRKRLSIFDTTLRDGEQAPGNAMSVDEKLRVAVALENLGVNVIEAGFPAASAEDFEALRAIAPVVRSAKLCAFARAATTDIDAACQALKSCSSFQLEILTTASDIHLEHKRRISREAALSEGREAVRYARAQGLDDVSVAPEDATRADLSFLRQMVLTVVEAGATTIGLPDTVGALLPHEFYRLVKQVRSWVGEDIKISVHAHNDLGLAVANTLAGIEAGADEAQVTLCGVGERAGNAALEEVVACVTSHEDWFGRSLTIQTECIADACQVLIDTLDLKVATAKAVIGANAFSTAAGIHQSGILREPKTYEFLDPARFGRARTVLLGRHSGRTALAKRLQALGVRLTEREVDQMYGVLSRGKLKVWPDQTLLDAAKTASGGRQCLPERLVEQDG